MCALTAQSKTKFSIGAEVFVRDESNRSWLSGAVSTLEPLTVQVEGWPIPMPLNFVVSKKPVTQKTMPVMAQKEEYISVANHSIGQVIGAYGKMINRIRRTTRAKITVYDRKSYSLDSLPSTYQCTVSTGCWHIVKIVGSEKQISKAKSMVCAAEDVPLKWSRQKHARRMRVQRHKRKARRKLRGCDMTEEMWLLQKEQHGTNGSWHTRKFKNKGKKHRQGWKEKMRNARKSNRKQTFVFANRRVSF